MRVGYVDTSCLVAVVFDEPGARRLARTLQGYDRLVASNLLEAELRSALLREQTTGDVETPLSWITWIYPNRPLTEEFRRIAAAGYLRGADLWHLAHALFLAPDAAGIDFLTLDQRQDEVSSALGFKGIERP